MYADQEKAFFQGNDDAWADRDPNPQQFKGLAAQQRYSEGYAEALKNIEDYYFQQCLDDQG